MLWFEREVVGALGTASDQLKTSSVEAFVEGSLRAMPEHIRAGVFASSVLLGGYVLLLRATHRLDHTPEALLLRLMTWETSPIGPLRQYVRMFRSLVLFSENEVQPAEVKPEPPEAPVPDAPVGTS